MKDNVPLTIRVDCAGILEVSRATVRPLTLTNVLINARRRGHVDIAVRIDPAAMAAATVETAQNVSLLVQDAAARR